MFVNIIIKSFLIILCFKMLHKKELILYYKEIKTYVTEHF